MCEENGYEMLYFAGQEWKEVGTKITMRRFALAGRLDPKLLLNSSEELCFWVSFPSLLSAQFQHDTWADSLLMY